MHRSSESIGAIAAALAKAQGELTNQRIADRDDCGPWGGGHRSRPAPEVTDVPSVNTRIALGEQRRRPAH
jgi:hypothetical protein